MNTFWGFAKARSGMIDTAASGLIGQRFEVYVPKLYERKRVEGGKAEPVARYRLPPYLFVRFESDADDEQYVVDQAGVVASQRGITHVFCDGRGRPQRVSRDEIEYLRQLEEEQMGDAQKRGQAKEPEFLPGAWVRIIRPENWAGHEGEVRTCIRGLAKVIIGNLVVTVNECDLISVKRPASERLVG